LHRESGVLKKKTSARLEPIFDGHHMRSSFSSTIEHSNTQQYPSLSASGIKATFINSGRNTELNPTTYGSYSGYPAEAS
jgi:hypothetical protein